MRTGKLLTSRRCILSDIFVTAVGLSLQNLEFDVLFDK
jgi:hypothetical protein